MGVAHSEAIGYQYLESAPKATHSDTHNKWTKWLDKKQNKPSFD